MLLWHKSLLGVKENNEKKTLEETGNLILTRKQEIKPYSYSKDREESEADYRLTYPD